MANNTQLPGQPAHLDVVFNKEHIYRKVSIAGTCQTKNEKNGTVRWPVMRDCVGCVHDLT
eukprot:1149870-Pelagomonas_calceolata.AAC.1